MEEMEEEPEREFQGFVKEVVLFFGGLLLIFLGLIISFGVITAIIGVPMMVAGYAMYKSSRLSGGEEPLRIDYREEDE